MDMIFSDHYTQNGPACQNFNRILSKKYFFVNFIDPLKISINVGVLFCAVTPAIHLPERCKAAVARDKLFFMGF